MAISPVYGTLGKRANLMMIFSGRTSMELLKRYILATADDPDVRAVVLDSESPGGTVDGTVDTEAAAAQSPVRTQPCSACPPANLVCSLVVAHPAAYT